MPKLQKKTLDKMLAICQTKGSWFENDEWEDIHTLISADNISNITIEHAKIKKLCALADLNDPEVQENILKSKLAKHEFLKPYMMDYWYPLVKHLTLPAKLIEFPVDEFLKLYDSKEPSDKVKEFLATVDKSVDGKTFVKTSNRSPKDNTDDGYPFIEKADDLINLFGGSMRIFDDLCDLSGTNEKLYLVLRPFVDIDPRTEFRCFVKDRELKGISQYFYDRSFTRTGVEIYKIEEEIKRFFKGLLEVYDTNDFVFDVFFDDWRVVLIEINPYGLSDPCLFNDYETIEKEYKFLTR